MGLYIKEDKVPEPVRCAFLLFRDAGVLSLPYTHKDMGREERLRSPNRNVAMCSAWVVCCPLECAGHSFFA